MNVIQTLSILPDAEEIGRMQLDLIGSAVARVWRRSSAKPDPAGVHRPTLRAHGGKLRRGPTPGRARGCGGAQGRDGPISARLAPTSPPRPITLSCMALAPRTGSRRLVVVRMREQCGR